MTDLERMKKFGERRKVLADLSDDQLRERFWELCHKAVAPLVELGRTHTSPSIERSVLLRMGVDSVSAQGVVAKIHDAGLLGRGAGYVVLKVSQQHSIDITSAVAKIIEHPEILREVFANDTATRS